MSSRLTNAARRVPRYLVLAAVVGGAGCLGLHGGRARERARVANLPKPIVTYVQAVAAAQCGHIAFVVLIRSDGTFRVLPDPTPEQIAIVNLVIPDPDRKTTIFLKCGDST